LLKGMLRPDPSDRLSFAELEKIVEVELGEKE
jgi:hypothetical protein